MLKAETVTVTSEAIRAVQDTYRRTFETALSRQRDPEKPEIARSFAQGEEPDLSPSLGELFRMFFHANTSVRNVVFEPQKVTIKLRPDYPHGWRISELSQEDMTFLNRPDDATQMFTSDTFVFDIADVSCTFATTDPFGPIPTPDTSFRGHPGKRFLSSEEINGLSQLLGVVVRRSSTRELKLRSSTP